MYRHAQAPSLMTSKATTVVVRIIPKRRAILQFLPLQFNVKMRFKLRYSRFL